MGGGEAGRVARLLLPLTAVNNRAGKTMSDRNPGALRPSAIAYSRGAVARTSSTSLI